MAKYQKTELKNLNFELCGGKVNIPLSIRLQEYPGMSDLWHSHDDFAELVIITNGKVVNELPDCSRPMQSGDIMIFYPGSIHRYNRIRQLRHYNVLFDPALLELFPGVLRGMSNYSSIAPSANHASELLHLDEKELFNAIALLENMRKEKINFSSGHEGVMLADFYLLIIHILRYAKSQSGQVSNAMFRIGQAVRFMERNFEQNFSLQQLCSYVHMSESSFRHHFRALTGLSPIDYLIKLRLRKAALMMFHSDQPISNIALLCGFSDGNYFARKFRQIFQASPREFRMNCSAGRLDIFQEVAKLQLPDI
ncbi:MAG: helix-turn-helix domain-containing protein [Lentisphaerae bacterium]|nr:helix-turn-helix domain-containing protein [Lentisphaerota bacterium]